MFYGENLWDVQVLASYKVIKLAKAVKMKLTDETTTSPEAAMKRVESSNDQDPICR